MNGLKLRYIGRIADVGERENGYCVCKDGHTLLKERVIDGRAHSIDIPISCSRGTPAALVHTHPSGNINLSDQDKETGKNTGLPICVTVKDGNIKKTQCYKVKLRQV